MDCANAQLKIISFIKRTMPEEEMAEFLEHIDECEDCRNELEIYYMLYVGYNSMEAFDEPDSYDLKGQLERELKLMRIYTRMSLTLSLVRNVLVTTAICVCAMLFAEYFIL